MTTKPQTAWAIFKEDELLMHTVRATGQQAVSEWAGWSNQILPMHQKFWTWEALKKDGYSCRKIEIKEVG